MIVCIHGFVVRSRQKIDYVHHALFLEVAGLKNVAPGEILLLGCTEIIVFRADGEVPTFVLVQDTTED
jgi:hypothetical protein